MSTNHADFKVKHGLVVNTTASFLSTVNSTSTNSGGVIISGGVGIAKDLYVGGKIVAQELDIQYTTVTSVLIQTDDVIKTDNQTSATNTYTGALIVAGGGGFGGDIYARNIFSNGVQVGLQSNTTTNLSGGLQWQIPYQQSTGTTGFIQVPPTSGTNSLLTFSPTLGFTWSGTDTIGTAYFYYNPIVDSFVSSGTTTTFTLSYTPYSKTILNINIDGVDQLQNAFSLVGDQVIFSEIPVNGANIDAQYATIGTQTSLPGYTSTGVASFLANVQTYNTMTGSIVVVGGVGVSGGGYYGGVVTATNFFVGPWAVSTASALTIQGFGSTLGTVGTINFSTGTTASISSGILTVQATGGSGAVTSLTAGTDTAVSGSTGAITIWANSNLQSVTDRGATTNQAISITNATNATSTSTGALIVSGGVGIGGAINVDSTATFGNTAVLNYSITTSATTPNQILAQIDAGLYRSAKVVIQASDSTGGKYHATEILCIHNGTTADHTEYSSVSIGGVCGTFTVDYSAGAMRILTTPASTNSTLFRISAQQIKL